MNNSQVHDVVRIMLQKGSDAGFILSTVKALKPLYEAKQDIAAIPKGTRISIMGCSIMLLEDAKVATTQDSLDYILKAQDDFNNGIGVASGSAQAQENLSIAGLHSLDGNDDSGKAIL